MVDLENEELDETSESASESAPRLSGENGQHEPHSNGNGNGHASSNGNGEKRPEKDRST
jgi:hypothetical protein